MIVRTLLGAVLLLLAPVLALAESATDLTLAPPGEHPIRVEISVFVIDVDGVDSARQSFSANVFYAVRWRDPRLAHDGEAELRRPLSEVWSPIPQIVNQQRLMKTFPEVVSIDPDGTVSYRQRVWGAFTQPLHLQDFPFDRQSFSIQLAFAGFRHGDLVPLPNPDVEPGIASELSVADWRVERVEYGARDYQPIPGSWAVPGFHLSFVAERSSGYYVFKIIVPLLLIVAMSWIAFWIDPKEASTQISVSITTMLTLIAYRFAVGGDLPKVSYLTRMDYFMLASTVLVFVTLMEAVVTTSLAKAGHYERALTIDRWARWVVPVGFASVALLSFLG